MVFFVFWAILINTCSVEVSHESDTSGRGGIAVSFFRCTMSCSRFHQDRSRPFCDRSSIFFLGEPEKNTLLMLQDEVNAKGGLNGQKVEMIIYDDESDVNKCVMAARKLIDQDQVAVVLGPNISGNTLAIAKFFSSAEIPLVSCSAAEKIVNPVDPWVFNTPQLDRHAVSKILMDAKAKKMTKLAILTVSDGYGQAGRAVLKELIPAQGFTLVADEVYGPKDTDMTVQLTKIKGTAPDAISCWGTNPGPAVVARLALPLLCT